MNTVSQSWWMGAAQASREAFWAALSMELPRMTTDTSAAAKVDALVTAQWSMGFPRRGATRIQKAGQS